MFLERHGIDLGAGEEREQDGADSREQRRVVGLLDVLANSWMLPAMAPTSISMSATEIPTFDTETMRLEPFRPKSPLRNRRSLNLPSWQGLGGPALPAWSPAVDAISRIKQAFSGRASSLVSERSK